MAEYIEREAVEEIMQKHRCSDCTNEKSLDCPLCQLHRPFDEISKIPTADVVPKSEVDKLEYTLTGVMHSVDKWLDGEELKQDEVNRAITMREKTLQIVENVKREVARAIFEDIEKAILTKFPNLGCDILKFAIAELKKKYTESEGERYKYAERNRCNE